jgi:Raf kinase inhibitor-like YbhB/YbcL family protein
MAVGTAVLARRSRGERQIAQRARYLQSLKEADMPLEIMSPAFAHSSPIPTKYARDGENLSPPLKWTGAPEGTRSFALTCEDPGAPSGTFRHWAIANIPADRKGISEGTGATAEEVSTTPRDVFDSARNDFGRTGYDGPAPPHGDGVHHYHFKVAALDIDALEISPGETAEELWRAARQHILAEAETVGTYQR